MSAQVVSFNCVLTNKAGQLISTTFNREVLTSVDSQNPMLAGLSRGLQNLAKGEKRTINLSAEEAYGVYDPKKVILYPKNKLRQSGRVGDTISITDKSGQVRAYKIAQLHDDFVSLDGNHPLAGQDLVFEIETLDARNATQEEIHDSMNPVSRQVLH